MYLVRDMQFKDLTSVVSIHLTSFAGFFLSFMGFFFLREFYKAMLLDSFSIAVVAEKGGKPIGFVVGTTYPGGVYKRILLKHWPRFLPAAIVSITKRPQTAPQLLHRLFMMRQALYEQNEALLMSIAVLPSEQGQGIGRQLVTAFLTTARERGASSVSLTTDKVGNDDVNRFYLRTGFKCKRSYTTPEGRGMNEYYLGFHKGV